MIDPLAVQALHDRVVSYRVINQGWLRSVPVLDHLLRDVAAALLVSRPVQLIEHQEVKETTHDDDHTRGPSGEVPSATGSPRTPQPDGSPHTPGPWRVQPVIGTYIGTKGDPYGHGQMHIADVRGWGHLTGRGGGCAFEDEKAIAIQTANARLIAAAPELLAALTLCRHALNEDLIIPGDDPDQPLITVQAVAARQADLAIAKAEGR